MQPIKLLNDIVSKGEVADGYVKMNGPFWRTTCQIHHPLVCRPRAGLFLPHRFSHADAGSSLAPQTALAQPWPAALLAKGIRLRYWPAARTSSNSLGNEFNTSVTAGCAYAYVHDVSRYEEVPALLRRIVADLGGLDLVVFVLVSTTRPVGSINITSRTTAR